MSESQTIADTPESKKNTVSIFAFQKFGDFFSAHTEAMRKFRTGYSYNTIARQIGRVSPSMLAMIARNKRFPDRDLLRDISEYLRLSAREFAYAEAMVGFARARSPQKRKQFQIEMEFLQPPQTNRELTVGQLNFFRHWYCVYDNQQVLHNYQPTFVCVIIG